MASLCGYVVSVGHGRSTPESNILCIVPGRLEEVHKLDCAGVVVDLVTAQAQERRQARNAEASFEIWSIDPQEKATTEVRP